MTHGKRPAFQFYPKDWRDDLKLQSCPLEAQGLWINMMCVMHAGTPYGHLAIEGVAIPDPTAAKLLGVSLVEYRRLLKALEKEGVPGRTDSGALFSRRMVRDEQIRQVRSTSGSLGGQSTQRAFAQAKPQANGKQTEQQSEKQMVATATADAEAEGSGKGGAGENRIRAALPEDARAALDGMLRAAQNPMALLGELEMIGTGHRIPGATWLHLGTALRDLALSGNPRPGGRALRAFVLTAMAEDAPAASIRLPRPAVEDEYDTAIQKAEAKEKARAG